MRFFYCGDSLTPGLQPFLDPMKHSRIVAEMARRLEGAPRPVRDLDHVAATPDTVLRRAAWLDDTYELAQSRVLMLGDHDATTLAFDVLGITVGRLAVVDIDDAVLAFLGARSGAELFFADLRLGLPAPLCGAFDLVVCDPPYSPEGVGLFAARGVQAIDRHESGRLVVEYGFPPASPALGLKVQEQLGRLRLVYEAVLPGFNRYDGAQAIGSRSDQYVLRLTRRSQSAAVRAAAQAVPAMYSHGRQAVESSPVAALDLGPVLRFEELLHSPRVRDAPVVVDLVPFHGRALVHAALAAQAPAVDVLVDNETPGVRSAAEQQEVRSILGDVRFERSVRGSRFTLVRVAGRPAVPPPFEALGGEFGALAGRRPIDLPLHLLRHLVCESGS
jgi:hypothetical protein